MTVKAYSLQSTVTSGLENSQVHECQHATHKIPTEVSKFNDTADHTELFSSISFYSTALRCIFLATTGH